MFSLWRIKDHSAVTDSTSHVAKKVDSVYYLHPTPNLGMPLNGV